MYLPLEDLRAEIEQHGWGYRRKLTSARPVAQPNGYAIGGPRPNAWSRVAGQSLLPDLLGRLRFMARRPHVPSDPAVVVLNPEDEVTPELFVAWLDRRRAENPLDPGVRAADTLAEARAAGEV